MSRDSYSQTLEIGAAYIRVSTDDQTELSPDAQLRVILDAAKDDGFLIPEEFIFVEQRGISGRKAENRPEFQRMIALAKSQTPAPFRRLYLWKFSRFARNQEESTFYKGILRKKCGVEIKSISEPIMEGMFGRLIETIIEWFDEYYSVNLSGEVLRGMEEKALRNGYQTSPCLGYQAAGNGKPFVIRQDKMAAAEFIHQAYHNGLDMTAIAREANRRGYRTNRGNTFERRTISRILANPFYIGEVSWNGITFQGTHELSPVITSVFQDNQARITREFRPKNRRDVSTGKHWLSGLLQCSVCGATLSISGNSSAPFFQCWRYAKGFHPEAQTLSVKKAERAVMDSLHQTIESNEVEYESIQKIQDSADMDRRYFNEALSRIEYKEIRVREAYEAGIDTIEEFKINKKRLQAERQALQEQLDQISANLQASYSKEDFLAHIKNVYELLSDPDISQELKGNAIRQIVKRIEYKKAEKKIRIHYYVRE